MGLGARPRAREGREGRVGRGARVCPRCTELSCPSLAWGLAMWLPGRQGQIWCPSLATATHLCRQLYRQLSPPTVLTAVQATAPPTVPATLLATVPAMETASAASAQAAVVASVAGTVSAAAPPSAQAKVLQQPRKVTGPTPTRSTPALLAPALPTPPTPTVVPLLLSRPPALVTARGTQPAATRQLEAATRQLATGASPVYTATKVPLLATPRRGHPPARRRQPQPAPTAPCSEPALPLRAGPALVTPPAYPPPCHCQPSLGQL